MLTTGEEPLSTDSSPTGVKTRSLEWYGEPFEGDEAEARSIYSLTKAHHGHAGPIFIRRFIAEDQQEPGFIKTDLDAITGLLVKEFPNALGSHLTAVSVITTADFYASHWVFGEDETTAMHGALDEGGPSCRPRNGRRGRRGQPGAGVDPQLGEPARCQVRSP